MFLPLGDDNSRRRSTPFVVYLIFITNVVVWLLELKGGDGFIFAYSAIPFEITHGVDLTGPMAMHTPQGTVRLLHTRGPDIIYLTVFSAMFMHGSWLHIIGNMLYLLIFADQIEDEMGHGRFLFFYVICGVAAGLAHIFVSPESMIPSLGASGAIAGVLGAYLMTHANNRVRVLVRTTVVYMPAYIVLGFWVVLQVLGQASAMQSAGSGVAYMAHIGGFIAGVLLVFLFRKRRQVA